MIIHKFIPHDILSSRLRLVALLSLIFLLAAFYLILSRTTRSSIKNQLTVRETTIARAIANNFQNSFEIIGNSTSFRAQLKNKELTDEMLIRYMDLFVEQWRDSGLVSGLILTDGSGIVRFNSNVSGIHDVGVDVSDRDYFLWAKAQTEEKKFYVGQPRISRLGASKGLMIVPVASPVITNGVFTGAYVTAVELQPLTERFLEMMKISEDTQVYLTDEQINIFYSSPGSDGLDVKVKEELNLSKEGQFQEGKRLFAYSPVLLGERKWLVVVSSPVQEVMSLSIPFYVRQGAVLVLVSLTTLMFGVIAYREGQNKLK